jgi:hypothetical protein
MFITISNLFFYMSNKGLTFIIILLLVLCGITFGAFYLKTNPEIALSKKIFGTTTASVVSEAQDIPKDAYETYTENTDVPSVIDNQNLPITPVVPVEPTVPVEPVTPVMPVTKDTTTEEETETKPVIVPSEKPAIVATLKKGSKGNEVKILQNFLIENNYLQGSADGAFGSKTEAAVKAFQSEYQLKSDGIVGGETRKTINEIIESN